MPKKRPKKPSVDRALEYIDSPMMTQRLRFGKRLSARIAGTYGTYRTQVRLDDPEETSCTCPSEVWPCKHVRALEATWKQNPESFYDLETLLAKLLKQSKADLLAVIADMAFTAPESLSVFGIDEFASGDVADEWYD
ncbi:MAG: SWIM zinc finger family protein [Planctomycetaceae bacterium]